MRACLLFLRPILTTRAAGTSHDPDNFVTFNPSGSDVAFSSNESTPLVDTFRNTKGFRGMIFRRFRSSREYDQAQEMTQRNRNDEEIVLGPTTMPKYYELFREAVKLYEDGTQSYTAVRKWEAALESTKTEPITNCELFKNTVIDLARVCKREKKDDEASKLLGGAILRLKAQFGKNYNSMPLSGLIALGDLYIEKAYPKVSYTGKDMYQTAWSRAVRELGKGDPILGQIRERLENETSGLRFEPIDRPAVSSAENIGMATISLSNHYSPTPSPSLSTQVKFHGNFTGQPARTISSSSRRNQ